MSITPHPLSTPGLQSTEKIISRAVREQLLVLDAQLSFLAASKSLYTAFQAATGQTVGEKLSEALRTLLNELPNLEGHFDELDGPGTVLVSGRRLSASDDQCALLLLAIRSVNSARHDVASAKHTGKNLREAESGRSDANYRVILGSMGKAVIVTDPEGRITFINPIGERLTGWTHPDALGKLLTEVLHIGPDHIGPDHIAQDEAPQTVDSLVARVVREGVAVNLAAPAVLMSPEGGEWPIDGNAAPILDASGNLAGIVLVFGDVGNRREAEQQLEISEVRYRRLFESALDGVLILDAISAKILDVNPFMTDLLGYPREHFLGKELWEIGVFKDAELSRTSMETLQRLGRIRYENLPLKHKDGRIIPVEFVSNIYREDRRNVIQCNIRDITERVRLATALAKATRDAETASRSKSQFLANMSHEIRTPMSAILGFANMLLTKSPEVCEQAGCVQIIQRNSLHLLELINEILDLSKVEAGQMKVERVSCDLPALLSEIVSLMRPRAVEKGLKFGVTFKGSIPRLILTDPLRLRQILVNLVGNSVKFTQSGRIDMEVTDEGAGGPNMILRIDVVDSGIGMAPELVGRLFVPFTQGDASITRKFGGTGLGLTISQQFAKLLGGDISARSLPGVGSTFTLKIDAGPSAGVERLEDLTESTLPGTTNQKVEATIHLHGRILLVEDGADNQRLFRMQLGDAGATVASALDGQIAVNIATTESFDLILMDMQMPIKDGYAATLELRRRGLTLPIIALTAHAMAEDRDKCLAAGCTGYLSKPVDEATLLRTVSEYLGSGRSSVLDDSREAGIARSGPLPGAFPPATPASASSTIFSSHIGNPRIMAIIPDFVAALPGKVHKLNSFLATGDLPGLQHLAHQLLGTCGGYGFGPVSDPARALEQSVKAGRTLDEVRPEVTTLVDVIRRIDGYDQAKELADIEVVAK